MSVPLTQIKAIEFDVQRGLFIGRDATLHLLRFTGRNGAGVNQYESLKSFASGWMAEAVKGGDAAYDLKLQIADLDRTLGELIDAPSGEQATAFAFNGAVYKLEPEEVEPPVSEPYVWTLGGYATKDVFE